MSQHLSHKFELNISIDSLERELDVNLMTYHSYVNY